MNDKKLGQSKEKQDDLQSKDDSSTETTQTTESSDTPTVDEQPTDTQKNADDLDAKAEITTGHSDSDVEDAVVLEETTDTKTEPESVEGTNEAASTAEESGSENKEPEQTSTEKKSRSWIGVLAFVLALCALIVAGYGFSKLQELQLQTASLESSAASVNESIDQNLQKTIAAASKESGKAEAKIDALKSELQAQQQHVSELQDRLTRATKQMSKIGTDKRKDWLLAEVEYLLRLANQRVLMEKSPVGALALLKSSDQILKETDDVSIYNVRKAIASDIASLESVPRLDVDGTFLKLAALNEQVSKLRLIPISDKRELPDMLKEVTPDSVSESWNQGLKASWNQTMDKLEKLIVIQHRDEPIEPLLSPEQVYFLQQNLHLMIEQAQLSLLQGQQGSYDASLNKATEWVSSYFEAEDSTTQSLLKGLNDLKSIQVSPALPDITSSLKALKAYLADIHDAKGEA
ncbi:uroporphyrinogen-III C-methyltransferase [Motiliproteus sp. MSK22-1]|uniref:uroporphyrinogen-III C-methyltransferase n=1 Tax=Motiliproteus sp. MSK22-1 TaxID=1897630 RepID=UPI0009788CD4|nr:uroporphyrinogen-III C-methyltransferase [Motiliproteus sp. MSK22-1]